MPNGVDFLMEGAKDKKNPNIDYASLVSALKARGVRFEVCEITLRSRNLKKDQFIMDAEFTPVGRGAHRPAAVARSTTPTSSPDARRVARRWCDAERPGQQRKPHGKRQSAQVGGVESDEVFEMAAEIFRVMSAPMRLKIISSLCNGEKNVSELLEEIDTTQPNMSQHLNTLYQAGVIGRRREGVQIFYRIINDRVVTLCRAVCTQIAIESDLK